MTRLIRNICGLAVFTTGLFLSSGVLADAREHYDVATAAWGKVLQSYVDSDGRTDFIALSENTADLDIYVEAVAEIGPNSNPDIFDTADKIMTYHINTYNALAMKGVIDANAP